MSRIQLMSWAVEEDSLFDGTPDPDNDPSSAYTNYSIEDASGRYLAMRVLEQATRDAQMPFDCGVRIAARWYLTNDTVDLRFICGIARVSHRYIIEIWTKRLGYVEPLPAKKRMFDFLKKEKINGRRQVINDENKHTSETRLRAPILRHASEGETPSSLAVPALG